MSLYTFIFTAQCLQFSWCTMLLSSYILHTAYSLTNVHFENKYNLHSVYIWTNVQFDTMNAYYSIYILSICFRFRFTGQMCVNHNWLLSFTKLHFWKIPINCLDRYFAYVTLPGVLFMLHCLMCCLCYIAWLLVLFCMLCYIALYVIYNFLLCYLYYIAWYVCCIA